jgi:AbrB family looped-hinge helix DNA binding protein
MMRLWDARRSTEMETYTKVTRHGQITLPSSVRRQLGIQEGDIIEISVEDERAVLVPKKLVDKSQAYFWSRQWQEAEREADQDIREGRVKSFESVEELLEELG